jgi:hypothetical protein
MQGAVPRTAETYVTRDGKDVFQGWLDGLADRRAKVLVDKTVAKIRLGNLGHHKSVGEGYRRSSWTTALGTESTLVSMAQHGLSCFSEARKGDKQKRSR